LALSQDNTPYLAYVDGDAVGRVASLEHGNWSLVGSGRLWNSRVSNVIPLVITPDGAPVAAFRSSQHDWKAAVVKYNDDTWNQVGSPGISANQASHISLT